jgi:sorbose reductase
LILRSCKTSHHLTPPTLTSPHPSFPSPGSNTSGYRYNSNTAAIDKAATLASTYSIHAKAYQVSVQDPTSVQNGIAAVLSSSIFNNRIDCLVANAGAGNSKPLLEMSIDEYRSLMGVNLDGVVFCAKFVGEVFKRQGEGNLIITSSISAQIVNVPVDQPVYNASKAAVTHLGKSLAREWRDFARVVSFASSVLCYVTS